MKEIMPLVIGVIGAIIGSGTTIISLILKEKFTYKRDLKKLALEMATSDFQGQVDIYKDRPNFVTPLPVLVNYYLKLIESTERDVLDEKEFKKLAKERHKLSQADIY